MGVLNVTPDSFSDGGRYIKPDDAIRHAERMAQEGADCIDVGGESTRPGARSVSVDEECRRVVPVIRALARRVKIPISIDTSKADVARQALDAGASMVNDVTALSGDPQMAEVVATARVPVILMHMRGRPQTMQRAPRYRNVVEDIVRWLQHAAHRAQAVGIRRDRLWLDPGLGFGKTPAHNLTLMRQLEAVVSLGYPVVIGPSKKTFIGHALDAPVEDRLAGTLACVGIAARHGVAMVRVHEVKAAVQFLIMWNVMTNDDVSGRQHRSYRHDSASALWPHA